MAAAPRTERLAYVDQLRAIAIIGVFLVHVLEPFNPWDEWHIQSAARSRVAGEIVVLMAPWIMPLFMLLAGVSAWYSLGHRSPRSYLRERTLRTLVPLVVGTLLLVPPQVWLERRLRGQFEGSFFQFLPHFFDGIYPRGNLSWHHLWFLAHLALYALVTLPLFVWWRHGRGRASLRWLARLSSGPGGLLWLALPLILERSLLWGLFPERHMLTSDWSNHALLLVAYVYGFVLAGEPWLAERIDAEWPRALATGLALTALLIAGTLAGWVPDRMPGPYEPVYLAFWSLYAIGAWGWMVGILGIGRRWLRHESPVMGYARANGYGWYLVHQPVIVAVAYLVVRRDDPLWLAITLVFLLSLTGTVAANELLRRVPVVDRLLGLRAAG